MLSASVIVPALYMASPVAAVAVAVLRARRTHNSDPIRNLIVSSTAGAVGGLALILLYIRGFGGHIPATQIAVTCYWGIAVAMVLRGINAIVGWVFRWITPTSGNGRPGYAAVALASVIARAAVLIAIFVAYLGAIVLTYRPRVINPGTPATVLAVDYQDVAFWSTDGLRLKGWWIPAASTPRTDTHTELSPAGTHTVIFCHGFGSDKVSQFRLVRDLVSNGYNVLVFDFRAHGESSGQFTTFGDLERCDVLGAVRWVRENHPAQSRRIFGLGEGLGAAALVGAAGDPSPEGQAFDAIAVFAPYDRLTALVQDVAKTHFVPRAGWIATNLALPIAGAQLGTPLAQFSPAVEADKIAPRPLLVVASEKDGDIDIGRSQEFYDQASQPKYAYWIKKDGKRMKLFGNYNSSMTVRVFFSRAQSVL